MRTVRYVARTQDNGIELKPMVEECNGELKLELFVDTSFGDGEEGYKSSSGYVLMEAVYVLWTSVLPKHAVSFILEAEVDSVHDGMLDLLWFVQILTKHLEMDLTHGNRVFRSHIQVECQDCLSG
jgi:hypothetical protein